MTSSDYPIRKHFKCCPFCTSCSAAIRSRVLGGIFHTVPWQDGAVLLPVCRWEGKEHRACANCFQTWDAQLWSRTLPHHHSPHPLTLSPSQPAEQQELGMEQHGDATTGVKPQHSASPGPSHRLNHPQISSVLVGTAQRLAEIPV